MYWLYSVVNYFVGDVFVDDVCDCEGLLSLMSVSLRVVFNVVFKFIVVAGWLDVVC